MEASIDGIDGISATDATELLELLQKDGNSEAPVEEVVDDSCWGAQIRHNLSMCTPGFKIGKGHVSRRPQLVVNLQPPRTARYP